MATFVVLLLLASLSSSPHVATAICVPRNASASAQVDASPPQLPSPTSNPPPATPPTSTDFQASLTPLVTPPPPSPVTVPPPAPVDDSTGHFPLPLIPGLKIIVSGLCGKTDHPDVCLSSILPLAHTAGGTVDVGLMLRLQIKACRAKIGLAQKEVEMLMRKPAINERTASNLQVCSDSYDDALDNLEEAEDALESKDRGTVNSMLSALVDDFATCEDGFAEMQSQSLLSIIDDVLSKMASNCLAFAHLDKDLH